MKTTLATLLLVILGALSLEGCGAGPTEPGPPVTPEPRPPTVTAPPSTTPTPCRNPKFPCED